MSVEAWSLVAQIAAALVAAAAAFAAWRAANASRDAIREERAERRLSILSEMHATLVVLLAELERGQIGAFLEHRRALERLLGLYGGEIRKVGELATAEPINIDKLSFDTDEALRAGTAEIWRVGHPKSVDPPPWWRLRERQRWSEAHPTVHAPGVDEKDPGG